MPQDAPFWEKADEQQLELEIQYRMQRMIGYIPLGTTDLLHVLTHPDLINITREYVKRRSQ